MSWESEPKRLKTYLKEGEGCCNCEDSAIEGGPFEEDGMIVTQAVWCTACGAEWRKVFKVASIIDFAVEQTCNA